MYKNLISVTCASAVEVYRHVLDFITARNGIADYSTSGLGWILHDSRFSVNRDSPTVDDWAVITSPGENGRQALYYRLLYSTLANSIIRTRAGLSWNATSNAWVSGFPTADQSSGPTSGTAFAVWIYGDLDHINIIIGNGSINYGRAFGLLDGTPHSAEVALTTAAVSAGSNVVIPLDVVPPAWTLGDTLYVRSAASIEQVTLAALGAGQITVAALGNTYGAGSAVAGDYAPFVSYSSNFVDTGRTQIGRTGITTDAGQTVMGDAHSTILGAADPDGLGGNVWVADRVKVYNGNYGYYGHHRHLYEASTTGLASGSIYLDAAGNQYRALLIDSRMYLLLEV